jgi:hypothetical protein
MSLHDFPDVKEESCMVAIMTEGRLKW